MSTRQLTATDFTEPFSEEDFIDGLYRKVVLRSKTEGSHFDPDILLITFEGAIVDIVRLSESATTDVEMLQTSYKDTKEEHTNILNEVTHRWSNIIKNFNDIDERVKAVSGRATFVGEQLEQLHTKRTRAEECKSLMNYFAQFRDAKDKRLDSIFTDPEKIHEGAMIIIKLREISREFKNEAWYDARAAVQDKYTEIERDLMNQYITAYEEQDIEVMCECAHTLFAFESYSQCVDHYLTRHPYLLNAMEESTSGGMYGATTAPAPLTIPDPNDRLDDGDDDAPAALRLPEPPKPPDSAKITAFFAEIYDECDQEVEKIHSIFKDPENVIGRFIEKVFTIKIKNYVDRVLQDIKEHDGLNLYLEILTTLHQQIYKLSERMNKFEINDVSLTSRLCELIMDTYTATYIEDEIFNLKLESQAILKEFYQSINHDQRVKLSENTQAMEKFLAGGASLSSGFADRSRYSVRSFLGGDALASSTMLSAEVALSIISLSQQSSERVQKLSTPQELAHHASRVYLTTLDMIGVDHVIYALYFRASSGVSSTVRGEPNLDIFDISNVANYIFHLLQLHFRNQIEPLLSGHYDIHRQITDRKNKIQDMAEDSIAESLVKVQLAILEHLKKLLSAQNKKDYRPPEDDISMLGKPLTKACEKTVGYLQNIRVKLQASLDGVNYQRFVVELLTRFHRMLVEHMRSFTISSVGGMILSRDMAEYRKTVDEFKVPALDGPFHLLHEVCNVFVMKEENVRAVLDEGSNLSRLPRSFLQSLIAQRADYRGTLVRTRSPRPPFAHHESI
eukprot:Clim_evm23s215 gene=Clim_evmTU23s215